MTPNPAPAAPVDHAEGNGGPRLEKRREYPEIDPE